MEVVEKMPESESQGSRSLSNLAQADNEDMKSLEKIDGDHGSAGGTSEVVVDATNGGDKPDGGVSDETAPIAVHGGGNGDHAFGMDVIDSESSLDDETEGHQQVNKGSGNSVKGDVLSDETMVVASEEEGGDDGKRAEKRMKYNEDGGTVSIVGGEPPVQPHNFKIRLFGFEISCYREDQGPKDGEGSSCTTSDPCAHGAAVGGGGCSSSGEGGVGGGEPSIQQP